MNNSRLRTSSPLRRVIRLSERSWRILSSPKAAVALCFFTVVMGVAALAPLFAPYGYEIQNMGLVSRAPSEEHWLGTDELGRDVLSRLIYGARTSITVAGLSIAISVALGMALGGAAAYFGGVFDRLVTSIVDLTWSFPEILIALLLVAVVGPSTQSTILAIGIAYLAQFTRLTRSQVLSLRGETYVEAAESLGASHTHIILRHLLPNALSPVLVCGMLACGDAIILEATLSFFGLGAQPPTPSWGAMMSSGSGQVFRAPWIIIFPGIAISATAFAINVFGDALIEVLDIKGRLRE